MTTEDNGRSVDRGSSVGNNSKAFYDIISLAITSIRRSGGTSALDGFVDTVKKKLEEERDPGYASRLKHGYAYIASVVDAVKDVADSAATSSPQVPPSIRNEANARTSNHNMMMDIIGIMKEARPIHEDMIPYPAIDHIVDKNSEGDAVVRLCSRDGIFRGKPAVINCMYDGLVCGKNHPDICLGPDGKPCFKQVAVNVNGKPEKCIAKIFKYKEGSPIKYWYKVDGNYKIFWYGKLYAGGVVAITKDEYYELEVFANKVRSSRSE